MLFIVFPRIDAFTTGNISGVPAAVFSSPYRTEFPQHDCFQLFVGVSAPFPFLFFFSEFSARFFIPAFSFPPVLTVLRLGFFEPPETLGDTSLLKGRVPVASSIDYMSEVNAYTKGRGRLKLHFSGYGPCHNAEEVIERTGYDSEEDVENPTGSVFCSHGSGFYVNWNEVPDYMHMASWMSLIALPTCSPGTSSSKS